MSKALHKVLWAEGMFLGQQHFQLWDRYHEAYHSLATRGISPLGWGLLDLTLEDEALQNAQYRIRTAQVIFPDGRLVSYDAAEDGPLVLQLEGGHSERIEVYLGLPFNRGATGINGYRSNGKLCAWRADYRTVGDEYDPERQREVMLGRPNLLLLTGEASRENMTWIKLDELVSDGEGGYSRVPEYVPPAVRIGASGHLTGLVQRLIELFLAKVRVLNERRRQLSASVADFGHSDVSNFLVLQALSGAIPLLKHFQVHPELHPEQLYQLLARVIGSLCPFSFELDVHAVPHYQHSDLTAVFAGLEQQLRQLIEVAMPAKILSVKLKREGGNLYSADAIDSTLLANNTFFLAVYSEFDDPLWVTKFERQVKVGARNDIEALITSAVPGALIKHTPRPPSNMPVKSGFEYFRIEPRGEFWDRIVGDQTLAVFLPNEFARVRMEVVTVQE